MAVLMPLKRVALKPLKPTKLRAKIEIDPAPLAVKPARPAIKKTKGKV
jgi:hypothetical protein